MRGFDGHVVVTAELLPSLEISERGWRMKFRDLMEQIERVLPDGGQWCTVEKAHTLAAMVVSLRPETIVEIGVWMGGSLIPLALAAKAIDNGCQVIGIDPWSSRESVKGQAPVDAEWWQNVDHEVAHTITKTRIHDLGLGDIVTIHRMTSNEAPLPGHIDILHIDGNHAEQAVIDVNRFAPRVCLGGFCILDDVGWTGGHVQKAAQHLAELGFANLYALDTGRVFQKVGYV